VAGRVMALEQVLHRAVAHQADVALAVLVVLVPAVDVFDQRQVCSRAICRASGCVSGSALMLMSRPLLLARR
jgi:hypothetical protein